MRKVRKVSQTHTSYARIDFGEWTPSGDTRHTTDERSYLLLIVTQSCLHHLPNGWVSAQKTLQQTIHKSREWIGYAEGRKITLRPSPYILQALGAEQSALLMRFMQEQWDRWYMIYFREAESLERNRFILSRPRMPIVFHRTPVRP